MSEASAPVAVPRKRAGLSIQSILLIMLLLVSITSNLVVGVLGVGRAYFAGDANAIPLAITVGVSIVMVVTVGSLLGALLPLLIQRVGLDPAVSSTPFIASLSDVVGLMVYLGTATFLMPM